MKKDNEITLPTTSEIEELYKKAKYRKLFTEKIDIVAFYNNNILVKRVIAESGDWVNITKDGTVYVNDKKINEPYIENKAYGEITIKFPY